MKGNIGTKLVTLLANFLFLFSFVSGYLFLLFFVRLGLMQMNITSSIC